MDYIILLNTAVVLVAMWWFHTAIRLTNRRIPALLKELGTFQYAEEPVFPQDYKDVHIDVIMRLTWSINRVNRIIRRYILLALTYLLLALV